MITTKQWKKKRFRSWNKRQKCALNRRSKKSRPLVAYISGERFQATKPWVYVLRTRMQSQTNPQRCCRRSSYFRIKGRKDRARESLFETSIRVKIDHNSTAMVALFGVPYWLRTDNGPQFASEDFETVSPIVRCWTTEKDAPVNSSQRRSWMPESRSLLKR